MNKDTFITLDLLLNILSFLFLHLLRQNVEPQLQRLRYDVDLLMGKINDKL